MTPPPSQPHGARRQANLRLAWILASVALAFGLGFMIKIWLLSH